MSLIVSRTWKNVQKGRQNVAGATKWVVHKGDKVSFFMDPWLPIFAPIRNHVHGHLDKTETKLKVMDLLDNGH